MTTSVAAPARRDRLGPGVLAVLAMCGGFSPFAIDTYLPGLPQIARDFGVPAAHAQLTLAAFLVPLGLMQLVIGPLSDRIGRRGPLVVGLLGSALASVVCALAPSIDLLVAGRFFQGAFGAAAIVLSRAIVADLGRTPDHIAKAFATVIAIQSIAPAVAPLVGGVLVPLWSWRSVFWFLTLLAVVLALAAQVVVGESLPPEERRAGGVRDALGGMGELLRRRDYIVPTALFWAGFATMFCYISASPFVLQEIAGFTPRQFAVAFALNSAALVTASVTSGRVVARVGRVRLATIGVGITTCAVAWLAVAVGVLGTAAWAVAPGFFVLVIGNGLLFSVLSALAISSSGGRAGSGSALLGAGQYLLASALAPLTGIGGSHTAVPMVTIMGVVGVVQIALLLSLRAVDRSGAYSAHSAPRPTDDGVRTPVEKS